MQHCEFCGSELPINAQFCGNCGHTVTDSFATATDITNPEATVITEPQTPPLFSSPMNPNIQGSGLGWQDTDSTFRTRWSVEDMQSINPQYKDRKTDENEAVLPDLLLPGMLAMQGQMPSPAQAPMVQGSPQFGGVPSVQGTPAAPGNVPQSIPGPAHGAASSAPSYAPQEPQSIPAPHQQVQQPWHQTPPHQYQPVHHAQPAPPTHELEHKHHHTGPLHKHKARTSRLHRTAASTSKAGMGVVSKWLIVIIASLVIIGSSSLFLVHELIASTPPILTISGTNVVRDGGILHLHGQGYQPGDGVTLTFDNGLPVTLAGQHGTQAAFQRADMNGQIAGLSQMNIAGVLQLQSAATTRITVSSSGTFDVSVTVPTSLPAGNHAIHATDNQNSQSARLQFTVPSPQLAVNPTALNFGSVEVGRTVKLSVTLSNLGGTSLLWTATVEGSNTNWLTLSNSNGVIGTNGSGEPAIVTASTNGLSMGLHSATLRFHSDNGFVQTTVKINVVSIAQSGQQAILNIPQQSLDFGQLQVGQQAQQSISIANLGNLPLQWQANSDAASASWLSLATPKGTVQPGAVPQTVQVNVNTTGLVANSYTGTINITSNGGNAQVGVTLVVTGSSVTLTPSPSPSPSPSPIVTPTVTGISPASGSSTGGIIVTITGTGFTGATSVSFGQAAASNITVLNDTQIKATNPAGSGTVDVFVTTPGGTSATSPADHFTYTIATPTWSVNPTSLDSSTCGQSTSCTVTLTEDASSTVNIDWTVSSDVGATFNLTKGTLKPGGQQPISISGITCKNGAFSFNGSAGASPLTVSWNCTIIQTPPNPMITVTPQNIGPTSSNCSQNTDGTYNCTVTVGETSAGNLNWFAPTGIGGTNISFKPANGQFTTSLTQQSVVISSILCSSTSFTFTDQYNNTATVAWSCTPPTQPPPPPTLTINPTGLSDLSGSPCTSATTGGIWSCTVTVMETSNSLGNLTWSASSSLSGVSFSTSGSTLTPGQSVQVTISNIPCVSSGTFTFSGGANPVSVSWNCGS